MRVQVFPGTQTKDLLKKNFLTQIFLQCNQVPDWLSVPINTLIVYNSSWKVLQDNSDIFIFVFNSWKL